MSVGQEIWIVATGYKGAQPGASAQQEKEGLLAELKKQPALYGNKEGPQKFEVPNGERSLLFGNFDNLVRLEENLHKYDQQVDGIVHRLERQYLELDPKAEFKVKSQRQEKPYADYLRTWQWDEAKYPKTRSISDNLTLLMSVVNRLDEEARNKTTQYNEFKTQKGNLSKKEAANLTGKDLIDVFTPDVVNMTGGPDDDFIMTDHLTTIPVILPQGAEDEFVKGYELMHDNIVPMSAKKFPKLSDKDGNTIWRVVMFRSAADGFKKACREKRWVVRDFEYSEENYKKLKNQREQLEEAVKRQHELVRGLYQAAWSDAMVAWMHIKAMRVFVETMLRYGIQPAGFASFFLVPKAGAGTAARKSLNDILGKGVSTGPAAAQKDDGDEEYFPYVSLSFTPFVVPRDGR
eukprot:TRINITY_DN11149_c0_g2_i1.p1 TRINITY_DN11149_c0_g2~~TRINITY_DN11149_c0_g2_i1.p1  ORF type:complete len:405 (+),score=114.06 TRINITY_DN11149_c0_g2_i1:90-1304(+)